MNAPMLDRSVSVGFRQRLASSLVQDFYPDGMPEDWRNNYLVMLTGAIWISEDDADCADVLAAVSQATRPLFTVLQSAQKTLPEVFAEWLGAHPNQSAIVLDPDEALWRPGSAATGCRIGLIPAQGKPAILRAWLEAFAEQAPGSGSALFIEGDSPSVPTLERVQTLVEFMGW
ncbi:MAG: hypothetical protein PF483_13770 [Halothiobacillus sp.]|nr:hypothetical protein [Halothiobacillus sp.]